jgi:hypothetical protein
MRERRTGTVLPSEQPDRHDHDTSARDRIAAHVDPACNELAELGRECQAGGQRSRNGGRHTTKRSTWGAGEWRVPRAGGGGIDLIKLRASSASIERMRSSSAKRGSTRLCVFQSPRVPMQRWDRLDSASNKRVAREHRMDLCCARFHAFLHSITTEQRGPRGGSSRLGRSPDRRAHARVLRGARRGILAARSQRLVARRH